jgi:hypothetical protein
MGSGCLAFVLGLIGLFRYWSNPLPGIWWATLILFILDIWFVSALENSLKMYGQSANETKTIGILAFSIQIALIVLGVKSFF